MKFAICNETFQNWPHEKAFRFARECGYQGIELAPFTLAKHAREFSTAARKDMRDLAARENLELVGLHWLLAQTEGYHLTTPDESVRRRTAEYLCELVRLCADLGGKVMVLGSPKQRNLLAGISHDAGLAYAADCLRGVLPTLAAHEITIAVEPLGPEEGDFLLTAESAATLCRMVRSPWVKLHLDVKAMSSEATPIPEIIAAQAGRIAHFHANDPNRRGPGMGQVDFAPIFAALRKANYGGWVSVEVFDYSPGVEFLARESLAYMRRILSET